MTGTFGSVERAEERVEALVEIALEIAGSERDRPRGLPALRERLAESGVIHLDDADRAVAVEDSDEDVLAAVHRARSHVQLPVAARVMQIAEGFSGELLHN